MQTCGIFTIKIKIVNEKRMEMNSGQALKFC